MDERAPPKLQLCISNIHLYLSLLLSSLFSGVVEVEVRSIALHNALQLLSFASWNFGVGNWGLMPPVTK